MSVFNILYILIGIYFDRNNNDRFFHFLIIWQVFNKWYRYA